MSEVTAEIRLELISSGLGNLLSNARVEHGAVLAIVEPRNLRQALLKLRDEPQLSFDILSHMTAVDYAPRQPRFEVVYELFSLEHKHRVRLKCPLEFSGGEYDLPEIDTVSDIYLTANWHERECYDLMGIRFLGHPDLRRIMLTDEWDGHPLRKEYPYDGKRAWKLGAGVGSAGTMDSELGL